MRRALALFALLALAAPAAAAGPTTGAGLYARDCAMCHGSRGEGISSLGPAHSSNPVGGGRIRGMGPPLRGVGALAADFYLRTGYMPLHDLNAQPRRRRVGYSEGEIRALVDYVASLGGGPPVPKPDPARGSLGEGLHLFTEHCAGCHQVVGQGGVVTDAVAPALGQATPVQIAEAVRVGPWVMPSFSKKAISDRQLDSIVLYVTHATRHATDRGGWAIGHLGPFPEGLVAWLVGAAALVGVALVIGKRLHA